VDLLRFKLSARPKTSYARAVRLVNRSFWHVLESDVARDEEFNIAGMKGTKSFHSVHSVGSMHVNKLLNKSLAYFCSYCLDCNWNACENLSWTLAWGVEVLVAERSR
jgi:hypothetical protein